MEFEGAKFIINLKTGRPSKITEGFATPNSPFNTCSPRYLTTECKGTQEQTPRLTNSSAIPSISPVSACTLPFSLGKGCPTSGKIDLCGEIKRDFVLSETKSSESIAPP